MKITSFVLKTLQSLKKNKKLYKILIINKPPYVPIISLGVVLIYFINVKVNFIFY
jgi:hypothetical protein